MAKPQKRLSKQLSCTHWITVRNPLSVAKCGHATMGVKVGKSMIRKILWSTEKSPTAQQKPVMQAGGHHKETQGAAHKTFS